MVKIICGLGGAHSCVPLNNVEGVNSESSGLTGQLFGRGKRAWGASSSDTNHSKSEALGNCFSLNLLINDNATPSAEKTSEAPSGTPRGLFKTSASEYKEAIDAERPWSSERFDASSISKSSTSSELSESERVSGVVEQGLTVVAA